MRKSIKLLAERKQEEMISLVKGILKERYITFSLGENIQVDEREEVSKLSYDLMLSDSSILRLASSGSGPVDAAFNALKQEYAQCHSIKDLTLLEFIINADMDTEKRSTSSKVQTVLVVENNTNKILAFRNTSRSILRSSIQVCIQAAEYFINCEEAIKVMYMSLNDARDRNRADLEQKYLSNLQNILRYVQATDLIEELKNKKRH